MPSVNAPRNLLHRGATTRSADTDPKTKQVHLELLKRQWTDVTGVLRTRAEALDSSCMEELADQLGVSDLLERALADVADSGRPA